MSKVLITGGRGFVGQYLKEYLENKGHNVYVSSRKNLEEKCIKLNLNNIEEVEFKLNAEQFDKIFHLSAQSSVAVSFKYPFSTMRDNITSTINLLEVIHKLNKKPKLVIAGTSEIYTNKECPVKESSSLEPRSPYAISKLATDQFITMMCKELKINSTILRLFNHTGPRQAEKFVIPTFSNQLAQIKRGEKEPIIKVGNLGAERDFTDVRDVLTAYDLVSDREEYGEVYNVCSGKPIKVQYLLDKLIEISGLNVKIEVDPARLRPIEIPVYYGNCDKIKNIGWNPIIPIEQTLKDAYEHWLKNI